MSHNNFDNFRRSIWPGEKFWKGSSETPLAPYITYPINFNKIRAQSMTPLMLATMSGKVVHVIKILSRYRSDLNKESNIIFDGLLMHGATALWLAACLGHFEIVKLLLKMGANVNHNTKAQSAPLRAACYSGHLDIVRYLIENGADVNLSNVYKNTCLMIAAYRGHYQVVDILLENGANPNEKALCGATALHYAAGRGHIEVCWLLLDNGATLETNVHDLSPVLIAAGSCQENVVELFISTPGLMEKEEIITALELLGASFANNNNYYDVNKAYEYLMRAMKMRYADSEKVIRKRILPSVSAYDDWFETENISELEAIQKNYHSIHMESLTIRERILGRNNPDLLEAILYRGSIMASQCTFKFCHTLWLYAMDLKMLNNISVEGDLLQFARLFSHMMRYKDQNMVIYVPQMLLVLKNCQVEIERNKYKIAYPGAKDIPRLSEDQNQQNIAAALYIIKLITQILGEQSEVVKEDMEILVNTVKKFIKSDTRLRNGKTLLHMAVNGGGPYINFFTMQRRHYPCFRTALLLVHAGASVLAVDKGRNTPLHTLVASYPSNNKFLSQAEKTIKLLINAGAHVDAINAQGVTPMQVGNYGGLSNIIKRYGNTLSLKCLASRCIAIHRINYKGQLPIALEAHIKIHSAVDFIA